MLPQDGEICDVFAEMTRILLSVVPGLCFTSFVIARAVERRAAKAGNALRSMQAD